MRIVRISNDLVIVSGGQTGADRAALDFAIENNLQHGGWCPRGRLAEDGPLAEKYRLTETPSSRYDQRTRWNVRDSDITLIVTIKSQMTGGTALTAQVAQQQKKPWLQIARDAQKSLKSGAGQVGHLLRKYNVQRLNVAGPRASQEPEVGDYVSALFEQVFDV